MTTETKPTSPTIERLKAIMARLNLNQSGLARYLGVPTGTVGNWMAGTREPNSAVVRLLDVLGTLEALAPAIHETFLPK